LIDFCETERPQSNPPLADFALRMSTAFSGVGRSSSPGETYLICRLLIRPCSVPNLARNATHIESANLWAGVFFLGGLSGASKLTIELAVHKLVRIRLA